MFHKQLSRKNKTPMFADVYGVNIPTVASFKQKCGTMELGGGKKGQ